MAGLVQVIDEDGEDDTHDEGRKEGDGTDDMEGNGRVERRFDGCFGAHIVFNSR